MKLGVVFLLTASMAIPSCGTSPTPALEPSPKATAASAPTAITAPTATAAKEALRAKYGAAEEERIDRGVDQVQRYWRPADGDADAFIEFVQNMYLPTGPVLDATFARFEFALERIGGYFTSMGRDLRRGVDLEIGPILPLDRRLAGFNASAHLSDDFFASKIAFIALLNFPLTTLDQRLAQGSSWTRRQWAEARLTAQFSTRVPAAVISQITAAMATADSYINAYNIYMHHLLDENGQRLFPKGLRLISHWGLRDELKARYADPDGLAKQRMIQRVMERIVTQEIPAAVINNPLLDWQPATQKVTVSDVTDAQARATASARPDSAREDDHRYRHWLAIFRAMRQADPYHRDNPTHIARRFNVHREIPETQVEALFEAVLTSPLGAEAGKVVAQRLGRDLEPFDIWYVGFKPRGKYTEAALDDITRKRYPTAAAYSADMPRMLRDLGFSAKQATFLSAHIEVEPSRGAGHAFGAARRDDKAHLRTRIGQDGMDYKGYNIAVHEMGHNVEQVFSVTSIDHTLLQGVPNTAFTEALAFVFQSRDLELLGLESGGAGKAEAIHLKALETFWSTREIAGVALVDMKAWRWLYEHPDATPAQFRQAVVGIAKAVWNRYFADIMGTSDIPLLAIYSHTIDGAMYTPDYPLGHLIAFQIEAHFRAHKGDFGAEFERICKLGRLTPDAWMRQAVGAPISAEPLLEATRAALAASP